MSNKSAAKKDSTAGITPSMPWRVAVVEPLSNYCLRVCFLDGTKGKVDISQLVVSAHAGVFAVLRDEALFKQVYVEHGVVTWPGELDLAPDAMYQQIKQHGEWILS